MFVRVSFLDRCLYGWAFVFIFSALCTTPKVWTARPQAYRVKHLKCLDRVFGLRAAKMFVRVGLLPFFGHFSEGVQGKKKPRDPNLQLGLTREAFSPKRLTRTNIQNPMFVPRGFFGPQSGAAQTSGGGKQRAAPPRRATEMARKWWFRRLDVWAAPDGLTRKG
jgi:hypothetical protein